MEKEFLTGLAIYVTLMILIWVFGWIVYDKYGNANSKIQFIFKWYDGWIGFFWDKQKRFLYIFPLPFFGIVIKPFRNNFN
jgi:uncharacterized membrane protein